MSATTVKLLQAAAEIAGSSESLAEQLRISDQLLAAYLGDRRRLPDALLLRAVDIILADRQSHLFTLRPLADNRQPLLGED